MFFKICRSPDSMPANTATQPASWIRSKVSESALAQRKYEAHLKSNLFRIIIRHRSLNRRSGMLKVSSMKEM